MAILEGIVDQIGRGGGRYVRIECERKRERRDKSRRRGIGRSLDEKV